MSIEVIITPCEYGYRFTFPAATAEFDEEGMAHIPGLKEALKAFGAALATQLGCSGVRLHGITFTKVLPRPEPNERY